MSHIPHSNRTVKFAVLTAASVLAVTMAVTGSPGYALLTFIIGLMVM